MKIYYMKRTNLFAKAALTLLVALFSLTGARAAATLTVYDGTTTGNGITTNNVVPINGSNVGNNYSKSQFIIPAAELAAMAGGDITVMTFYAQQASLTWYGSTYFEVYVKEVTNNTISALEDWSTLTSVYSGGLGIGSYMMTIPFNTPFKYNGGNLLVGIRQTDRDNSSSQSRWYGETVTGASMGGYHNNATSYSGNGQQWHVSQQNFIPKTTFTYLPGYTPTNVTVNSVTYESANISWTGSADSYVVKYRTKRESFSENFDNGIPTTGSSAWTIYTDGTTPNNNEGWVAYEGMAVSWSWYADLGAFEADNWLISPAVELGGTLKFDVKTAQWHDSYEVLLSTTGIAESDFDITLQEMAPGITGTIDIDLGDYQGETGHIAIHHVDNDQWYLDIDNFEVTAGHAWKEVAVNGNTVELTGLLPDTKYEFIVIGKKANSPDAEAPNATFTTEHTDNISLANATDNKDMVIDLDGRTYNVTLAGRTLSKGGNWNTLCLPFNVTISNDSPLAGAEARELSVSGTKLEDKTLTLAFSEPVTELVAGTPYIIRWTSGANLVNPVFNSVTFSKTMHDAVCTLGDGVSITFKGSYAYKKYTEVDQSILFISSNKIYYVGENTTIGAQRAYFQLKGIIYGSTSNGIKEYTITLDDDDPTGINNLDANDNEIIYNLAGMRIGKMQKGINIVNGKKIIVK